jgi:hypothetical protein
MAMKPFFARPVLFLFFLAGVMNTQAENLIQNGDFAEKKRDWKMSRGTIEEDGENKFVVLEPTASGGASMEQDFDIPDGARNLSIAFRYKFSEDFKSRQEFESAQVRMNRGNSYVYWVMDPAPNQWKEFKGTVATQGARRTAIGVLLGPAKGTLTVDDVVILAK